MSNSKQWALSRLSEANTIFEPNGRGGWTQALNFVLWCLECGLIWYVAQHWVKL